jgi:predicted nucleic acid-binding Zn ribbon protein
VVRGRSVAPSDATTPPTRAVPPRTPDLMTSTPTPMPVQEPLHGCVRCGARIPVSQAMCEQCNPLGLKEPAPSQAHATVFIGIIAGVVLLAVAARLVFSGVGPFEGGITNVAAGDAGLEVTLTVTNAGSGASSTTCRITDPSKPGIGPETAYVTSPIIQPGATLSFDTVVTSLGTTVKPLDADCDTTR